ncbi:serine hydrolase domain-containing protein [Pseudofulvibacter geojedonensis]|uniref:Serine hydrolase domain-containing protein n=1 Tax=Pseudofulvibacter geojedonensis TaxID=1123758 RepID=A0ABW3I0Z7_9FLAO
MPSIYQVIASFFKREQKKEVGFLRIHQLLKELVGKEVVPGIGMMVSHKSETVFSANYGYKNLKSKELVCNEETLFRIASVSKPISAFGLAKLVSEGKINLKDSLYIYLPDFPKNLADIRIEQLANHTSGFRANTNKEFFNDKPLSIQEGLAFIKKENLLFEPGTDYNYSSYNWNVLSAVIEEVIQKPFEVFMEKEVLHPLKMMNTIPDKNESLENQATPYKKIRGGLKETRAVHNFYKLAGGGYLSTVADITRFGNAVLKNKNLLRDFLKQQFVKGVNTYYGLGFQVTEDNKGRKYVGHEGNGLGGYAMLYVYPDSDLVITILMNCSNPNKRDVFTEIVDTVFNELDLSNI